MRATSKLTLLLFFAIISLVLCPNLNAQVTYFEDFENGIPADYTLIDNDGNTPTPFYPTYTDAWNLQVYPEDTNDHVISSISYYQPEGMADDWIITPKLKIDANTRLQWNAKAHDPDFRDGYEIWISNTGNQISDFQAFTPVFTIQEEITAWIPRYVNLWSAGWTNDSVYIAFRNNSDKKYFLHIDDIALYNPYPIDLKATQMSLNPLGVTCGSDVEVTIEFTNFGLNAISGFDLKYAINGSSINSENYSGTVNPGDTISFTFTQLATLNQEGRNVIEVWTAATGDGMLGNDSMSMAVATTVTTSFTDDLESGNGIYLNVWSNEDASASIVDFAGNNSGYGIFLEGRDGADGSWDNYTNDIDIWANNQSHSAFAGFCFDPGGASLVTLDFDMAQFLTPFTSSYWYNNMRILVNGNQVGNTYRADSNVAQFNHYTVDLSAYVGGPMEVVFESRNKYNLAFTRNINPQGTNAQYGDFIYIDNIEVTKYLPPIADFTFTTDGFDATFTDQSINVITDWIWDFGNGDSAFIQNPTYTYPDTGTFDVCLTVSSPAGSDVICQQVTIFIFPPIPIWSYTTNDLEVTFMDSSTNNPTAWIWDFGTGDSAFVQHPVYTFPDSGEYEVCLTPSNIGGSNTVCKMVAVDSMVGTVGVATPISTGGVNIFPNPTNGMINLAISDIDQDLTFEIWNAMGEKLMIGIFSSDTQTDQRQIDLSDFSQGIYFIQLKYDKKMMTHRIVKLQ